MSSTGLISPQRASETATRSSVSRRPTGAASAARAGSPIFNLGLLAALMSCAAFWLLVALTAYWLM